MGWKPSVAAPQATKRERPKPKATVLPERSWLSWPAQDSKCFARALKTFSAFLSLAACFLSTGSGSSPSG